MTTDDQLANPEGRQIDTRATSLPRGRAVTARHDGATADDY